MPMRWLLMMGAMLTVPLCLAQMKLLTPSDAAHLPQKDLRTLLRLVCLGHALTSGCDVCPAGASSRSGQWDLNAAIPGHFVSQESEDVLLSGSGCEDHADGYGGSFLFTRSGGEWHLLNYAPARIANDCKKLNGSDGRDLLICEASDRHFGVTDSFLYLLDPRDTAVRGKGLDIFFIVDDSLGGCTTVERNDRRVVESGSIDKVAFAKTVESGMVKITVDAMLGEAVVPEAALADCEEQKKIVGNLLQVNIRRERLSYAFAFDGKAARPLPDNPALHGSEASASVESR